MTLAPLTSGPWQDSKDTQFEVVFRGSETDHVLPVEIRTYEVKLAGITLYTDTFRVDPRHQIIMIDPAAVERAATRHVMTTFALRLADVLAVPPAPPETAPDANGYPCCRHCGDRAVPATGAGPHTGGHKNPCTQGCQ
jgi:hypothetical protein